MANQYDTNLKLQAIADAIGDSSSSGLISALEDIADAVAGGGGGGSSAAGLVSDNFSETDTYDLGDFCIHNNTLYVCINAITTPGPWDLSDWQATNAGLELSSLNSALDTISGALDNLKFKVYLNLQIPFSNSVDSGFNVSDVDANLANAKVLIPMCLGSFSSATMNGAKTFVAIHLIDTSPITATKSMNLLAVF